MSEDFNVVNFDEIINSARTKLRGLDKNIFGGEENSARIDATIGKVAPMGTIGVPKGIDTLTTKGLMATIDLTLLNEAAEKTAVEAIARRAKDEHAASVCVYPEHVSTVQYITTGNPPPIAVVGFPAVVNPSEAVLAETLRQTQAAISQGAKEIDMVLAGDFNRANPDYAEHYKYIRAVVKEAGKSGVPVKVILETAYLADSQKVEASMLAKMAGATFVKTSTGFAVAGLMRDPSGPVGATPYDVALMRRAVGDTTLDDAGRIVAMGVKASGGIRTRHDAIAVCEAGANRIGASGGIDIRSQAEKELDRDQTSSSKGSGRY